MHVLLPYLYIIRETSNTQQVHLLHDHDGAIRCWVRNAGEAETFAHLILVERGAVALVDRALGELARACRACTRLARVRQLDAISQSLIQDKRTQTSCMISHDLARIPDPGRHISDTSPTATGRQPSTAWRPLHPLNAHAASHLIEGGASWCTQRRRGRGRGPRGRCWQTSRSGAPVQVSYPRRRGRPPPCAWRR